MDIRVLKYFLAVAEEGSFLQAAQKLNLTQPTLSRQVQDLEKELGGELLTRGKRRILLTEKGRFLKERAEEVLELVTRTENELAKDLSEIGGDIHVACGETQAMDIIAKSMTKLHGIYPAIKFHIFSGNAEAVAYRLDNGLADFGIFIRPANLENYDFINLRLANTWGLLMKKDNPLAEKEFIDKNDLLSVELLCSQQAMAMNELAGWMGGDIDGLNIISTYNLLFNAGIMVKNGLGCALCLDGIADVSEASSLCFRKLNPELTVGIDMAWKKGKVFTPAVKEFLKAVRDTLNYLK